MDVSSGSVSSGISSPTDEPRGRLLAPTAELKKPIMASVWQGWGGGCMRCVRRRRGGKECLVISRLHKYEYR